MAATASATEATHDMDQGRSRVLFVTALVIAALTPMIMWLTQFQGPDSALIILLVTGLSAVFNNVNIDFEFRHENHRFMFLAIPMLVGLSFLSPLTLLAIQLAVAGLTYRVVENQPLMKLVVNLAIVGLDTVVAATVFWLWIGPDNSGVLSWFVLLGGFVLAEAAGGFVTIAVMSSFLGRLIAPSGTDLVLTLIGIVADVTLAVVFVTLLRLNSAAAALVLVIGVTMYLLAREYTRISTRYRGMNRLNNFAIGISSAVNDGTVFEELLYQAAETLHAETAWITLERFGEVTRFEIRDRQLVQTPSTQLDRLLLDLAPIEPQIFTVEDETTPSAFAKALNDSGHEEIVAVELTRQDSTRLVLVIADRSTEVRPFDREDADMLGTVGVHANLSLQNVDLVERLRLQVQESDYLASHDSLTDLPNRSLLLHTLDEMLGRGDDVAVILLDLDRFKEVNDTLGHENGDLVLIEVAARLSSLLEDGEMAARLGGDEFAVIVRRGSRCDTGALTDDAFVAARNIANNLHRSFAIGDVAIDIAASVGISLPVDPRGRDGGRRLDAGTMLRQADVAMYLAKEGRTVIECYSSERDHYNPERLAMASRLRAAIDHGELVLHYQPQVHIRSGVVESVEALVRWPQPDGSFVPPDSFISLAEHTGLIHQLTRFVVSSAVEQAAIWYAAGTPRRVSMNLSAYNLTNESIVDLYSELLAHHRLPPELLVAELTESAVISDSRRAVAVMERIRQLGIGISIDDFGTGQSSLSYLANLPATELKIDRSFITPLGTEPTAEIIVRATVELAQSLRMHVVAEGIETEEQLAMLSDIGCDYAQGFYFSRALEPRGLELWVEQHRADAAQPRLETREVATNNGAPTSSFR